ncbi:MAG: N-acetylmuramoyl-L-alanine amidase [Elusimicrobia bacterium]|nr:N-acetylmuramoyl-L-alanine amidase [Elusimicrobiota bacterium]
MGRLPHHPRIAARALRALCVLAAVAVTAAAEDVPVFVGGKEKGTIYVYKAGDQRWLDAKQAAGAFGGSFVWQAVSGKVQLSIRGRLAQFTVDAQRARVVDSGVDLPDKVIVRANTVLVPVEFFSSKEFGDMAWSHAKLEEKGFVVTPRGSVGPMRWFSHKDHTRIVLELDPQHAYQLSRRGRSGLEVTIPLGTVEEAAESAPNDGFVATVRLWQESKLARLSLELDEKSPKAAWDARTFEDPNRLVIDVYHDDETLQRALAAKGRKPEPVKGEAAPSQPDPQEPASLASIPAAPAVAVPAVVVEHKPVVPVQPEIKQGVETSIREKRKIVVDPGHGGQDSGATGRRGVREKDINLLAARELARMLKDSGEFEVLLTRDTDVFIPLAERSQMANDFGADLFVSLHCNANNKRSEKGFEIYFLSERASDPEAEKVAERENASLAMEGGADSPDAEAALLLHAMARTEYINDAGLAAGIMSKALGRAIPLPDRGVKQAAFYVLRGTNAPAVLVEMGFVSNPNEESKLDTKSFRRKIVEGVYGGIRDFARRQEWISSSR